jgi:hypothetical protein
MESDAGDFGEFREEAKKNAIFGRKNGAAEGFAHADGFDFIVGAIEFDFFPDRGDR